MAAKKKQQRPKEKSTSGMPHNYEIPRKSEAYRVFVHAHYRRPRN